MILTGFEHEQKHFVLEINADPSLLLTTPS